MVRPMSDLASLIAQLGGSTPQPAADPALAAVKLARASIEALVLKLGQTIDAKVVGQLAAGLTQLTAGTESFVLKLETPLPPGTAVTIKVTPTPQGTPAVTVSVPATTPPPAQPLPVPSPTAPLVQAQAQQPAAPTPATPQPLPQVVQLPLAEPAPPASAPPAAATPPPAPAPATQPPLAAQPATPPAQPQPQPAASVVVAQPAPPPAAPAPPPAAPAPASATPLPTPQSTPTPTPSQPAAQAPLPVTAVPAPVVSALPTTTASPPPSIAPAPPVTVPPSPAVATAAPPPAAVSPAPPAATPPQATQPAPILTTALAAQPQQPLPTHPSPYPVRVPQTPNPVVAQQLPLPAAPTIAAPRPVAPPLNLADPAQAAARQDSAAPLMARLAAIVTATAPSLPRPVIELALKVLAGRVDLNRGAPDANALEAAVLKAGVLLALPSREAPADARSTLLALRTGLLALLGGDTAAPVTPAERPAPPLKGEPPRAPAPQAAPPDLPADSHETARALLGHTDAALSRLKLLQSASQPAADTRIDAPAPRNELRVEIPMLLGAETGIMQLLVERDGRQKRAPDRQRGWRMRFAMSFSATGEVGADIAMLGRSASITIWAADPDLADALDTMLPELAPAIQQHGLELTSLRVRRGTPQPARPAPGQLLDSAR